MRTRSICIAIIFLVIAGCKPAEQKKEVRDNTINIRTQPAEIIDYIIPVKATGILGTTAQVKLSFKTGGIIKQLNVREGESVSRGAVLAVLDLSEVNARVNQARIAFEKSERDLRRAGNLYRDSVVTLEQYEDARSAFEVAKAQKQIAEFNLSHSRIKAPSNGKIQKILVEANEMIAPGYPALLFASTENDWVVRSSLIDKDIVRLSIGDSAHVTMDAFPDNVFKAEITELGTVADPVTGTYEVELLIFNSLPRFRTGFFSRVKIYPNEIKRLLVVPVEALLDVHDNTASVFVYEQGKAMKQRVTTGSILEDRIVILEGLQEGASVITDGAKYVRDDSKVHLLDQPESQMP